MRERKRSGFARTKKIPHKKHPAYYIRTGQDEVHYITFTHSAEVEIDGETVKTIPLTGNIDSKEYGIKSYVYPAVYVGKRSALGKDSNEFSLTLQDQKIADNLLKVYGWKKGIKKERVPASSFKLK